VLVVEDDRSSRLAMAGILRSCGSEVITVASVAEALSVLRSRPIDAVVLDLMLPDGDGTNVLREVRAMKLSLRVCVVTAVSDSEVLGRVKSFRPDALLRKPIDVNELLLGINLKGSNE
jgi:two-component system, OmpR family, response regulator QseB